MVKPGDGGYGEQMQPGGRGGGGVLRLRMVGDTWKQRRGGGN